MQNLDSYIQNKQSELFKKHGVIFCFSNKQFEEQRVPNVHYVSVGMGTLVPKDNANSFLEELDVLMKKIIKKDLAENGREKIILRELLNYECFYTGDIDDCVDKLEDYSITREEIAKTYRANLDTYA